MLALGIETRRKWRTLRDDQGLSGSDPKIGHENVEFMAIMSWRRRLSEYSCLPPRCDHNE
jgi:hypothetical protein